MDYNYLMTIHLYADGACYEIEASYHRDTMVSLLVIPLVTFGQPGLLTI